MHRPWITLGHLEPAPQVGIRTALSFVTTDCPDILDYRILFM